ncbi:MAG: hypothetical protein GWN64_07780 [Candidatus Thorarchaeota archaeon]|nr:hypothetical protein [Candidatus Thorarchaeota archaeon]
MINYREEIEKLEAERKVRADSSMLKRIEQLQAENKRLKAERDDYRDALESIVSQDHNDKCDCITMAKWALTKHKEGE